MEDATAKNYLAYWMWGSKKPPQALRKHPIIGPTLMGTQNIMLREMHVELPFPLAVLPDELDATSGEAEGGEKLKITELIQDST